MKLERWQPPENAVDEMLKLMGVPSNYFPIRQQLRLALEAARTTYNETTADREPVPRKDYDRVVKAVRELSAAMSALDRRYSSRSYGWLPSRSQAQHEIDGVLRVAEAHANAIKRGQPRKDNKVFVAYIAIQILHLYSPTLQGNEGNLSPKHVEFLEVFYETVTGETESRGKLDWAIRKARDALREPEVSTGV
jgi:hypothetical protein